MTNARAVCAVFAMALVSTTAWPEDTCQDWRKAPPTEQSICSEPREALSKCYQALGAEASARALDTSARARLRTELDNVKSWSAHCPPSGARASDVRTSDVRASVSAEAMVTHAALWNCSLVRGLRQEEAQTCAASQLGVLEQCYTQVENETKQAVARLADETTKASAVQDIAGLQLAVWNVDSWLRRCQDPSPLPENEEETLPGAKVSTRVSRRRAREAVQQALGRAGLTDLFFGALLSGPVFQSTAKSPDDKNPQTGIFGTVFWESKHAGSSKGSTRHLSVGGKVGYEPIFVMNRPKDKPDAAPLPGYSGGLAWDIGPNFGVAIPGFVLSEITAFGRYGQTRPGAAELVNEKEPNAQILVPSNAETGLEKDYFEAGLKVAVFRGDLGTEIAHERGYLLPAASARIGIRWDHRFKDDDRLRTFDTPQKRYFFGFRLNLLKVFTDTSTSSKPYSLTFAVEHEWGNRGSAAKGTSPARIGGLPAGTRILIAGSVDLLRALGATAPPASPKAPEASNTEEASKSGKTGGK